MAFLLFLIVLVINYNNGMARPTPDNDVQIVTRNGIDESERIFKLPTVLRPGLKFIINGKLNTAEKMFQVVLHDKQDTSKDCNISYDYESEKIKVTSMNEEKTADYELDQTSLNKQDVNFALKVGVRKDELISVVFEVGEAGQSSAVVITLENKENLESIEIMKGVTRINSLSFTFS